MTRGSVVAGIRRGASSNRLSVKTIDVVVACSPMAACTARIAAKAANESDAERFPA